MLESELTIDGTPVSELSDGSEKRVALVCDLCGAKTETFWHNYIQYQRKRDFTGETVCQKCAVRRTVSNNRGKPKPWISERNRRQKLESHPSWKGGRYLAHDGYIMVRVEKGRSNTHGWKQYRKEHLVVMEEFIGRSLTEAELVHHVDLEKTNNELDNLWLTDGEGHRRAHWSLQLIGIALYKAGIIGFDRIKGEYIVADRKLRELLERPGEGNQQPSLDGNNREGSETRERVPEGQ